MAEAVIDDKVKPGDTTEGKTAIQTDDAKGNGDDKPGTWPDNWRQLMAGDDEKELKRLDRFADPSKVYGGFRNIEKRMSSGDIKSTLPTNATDEDKAKWRTENGIPEKAEDYELKFPDGTAVEATDKETLKVLTEAAHKIHLTPSQFSEMLSAQYQATEQDEERQKTEDVDFAKQIADELHESWGRDFRLHQSMIQQNVSRNYPDLYDKLMRGRLSDGTPIGSSKEVLAWILDNEREINPASTIVPAGGGTIIGTVSDRIIEIKALMGNRESDYWKGPKSEGLQAEYRKLTEAQEKIAAKS